MDKAQSQLFNQLQVLREKYIADFPERVQELMQSWAQYCKHYDPASLKVLHRQAHSLKGSGATYGFDDISTLATGLNAIFSQLQDNQTPPDTQEQHEIEALLVQLDNLQPKLDRDDIKNAIEPQQETEADRNDDDLFSILIVMKDASELDEQLSHFGYQIHTLPHNEALAKEIRTNKPDVIIIDADSNGIETIKQLKADTANASIACIFLANDDSMISRLEAVRAGASSYHQQPVNISDLIDKLDTISFKKHEEPNRILIVEDTQSMAAFFQITLESVGMKTVVVTDPMNVLKAMSDFNPELILMDMYMPECSGQELASIIRQFEDYVSIPIVFLSSERDMDKQLEAMRQGGDDFLTKPINPDHLIASVETRTKRYRKLRSLMVRDSLTGLFNHTKTKQMLEQDVYRTARNKGQLVFAMLDIDHFKQVNDNYGHPMGDKVIKSLARILKQRLRKSDTIGRYGGEEFAVILFDTDIANAHNIINKIRKEFSHIKYKCDQGEFQVTFSCGLASFPELENATDLNEAADKALYQAKHTGRNKVSSIQ